jgi:hypothetical protein
MAVVFVPKDGHIIAVVGSLWQPRLELNYAFEHVFAGICWDVH